MSSFFDVCVPCKRTFTSEAAFMEHMNAHSASRRKSAGKADASTQGETMTARNGTSGADEDSILAAAREVNKKRKKLIAAGIEAATMTPDEVEARFAEEKKKGRVK